MQRQCVTCRIWYDQREWNPVDLCDVCRCNDGEPLAALDRIISSGTLGFDYFMHCTVHKKDYEIIRRALENKEE